MNYTIKGTIEKMIKIGSHVSNNGIKMLIGSVNETLDNGANAINEESKIKYNEKEELIIITKALHRAVHIEELLSINALLVPLEHMLKKYKKIRFIYEEIKLLIADIYY